MNKKQCTMNDVYCQSPYSPSFFDPNNPKGKYLVRRDFMTVDVRSQALSVLRNEVLDHFSLLTRVNDLGSKSEIKRLSLTD